MSFSKEVVDAALVASGRCCCICHKFCGVRIETHHIRPVSKGGDDTFENCIPLCFEAHRVLVWVTGTCESLSKPDCG